MTDLIPHEISDVAEWGDKPTGPWVVPRRSDMADDSEALAAWDKMAESVREQVAHFPTGD